MKAGITFAMLVFAMPGGHDSASADQLERIRISENGNGFSLAESGNSFVPWGVNYDHDERGRLIEDYWTDEWEKVEADFHEIKQLGANVVRIHLQFGRFMEAADRSNGKALDQLARLVRLAEADELYLDLTGLGCYHQQDVPAWYDELDEQERWNAQARFWEAIAARCAGSNAIFCYDLMNEPVIGGQQKANGWLGPAFAGKHFVQFVAFETKDRARHEIAKAWIDHLVKAVRQHDQQHLITVGLVPWSLDRSGMTSGFVPDKVADSLDFIAVHIYPETGKLDEAQKTLTGFAVGKPVVIEEIFPLKCSAEELGQFIDASQEHCNGWIGFYWGKTTEEYRQGTTIGDAIVLSWLELFTEKGRELARQ